ncbi:hypothetical protein CCHR01_11307 [Colletotrichum chrysophilum]|uniref:Uncharacterized protein n=1 Tax=Colletotrichum chrysophilum TaxID=1836956 RepID=A0AAD9EII0_9PEZI|nr:hypothetical protein CCHR01_11307 [Colletotrichum chrysophilum]
MKGGTEIFPTSRQPAVLAKLVGERVLGVAMTDRRSLSPIAQRAGDNRANTIHSAPDVAKFEAVQPCLSLPAASSPASRPQITTRNTTGRRMHILDKTA